MSLHGLCTVLLEGDVPERKHMHICSNLYSESFSKDPSSPPGLNPWDWPVPSSCLHSLLLLTEIKRKSGLSRSAWRPLNLETAAGCCYLQLCGLCTGQILPPNQPTAGQPGNASFLGKMGTSPGTARRSLWSLSTEEVAEINTTLQSSQLKPETLCLANFLQVEFGGVGVGKVVCFVFSFSFSSRCED